MKKGFFVVIGLLCCLELFSQKTFTGLVKYKITVEGTQDNKTDSMTLVFDTGRVKLIMYIPDLQNTWYAEERVFMDDFSANKSYKIDASGKLETDSLRADPVYIFRNTNRYGSVDNKLGFVYEVDPKTLTGQDIRKISCVSSLEYFYPVKSQYAFLGYQPVVIDGRLVLDYTITQSNGSRPRVYVNEIIPLTDVRHYFKDFDDRKNP